MDDLPSINRRQYLTATAATIPASSSYINLTSDVHAETYIYVSENGSMYVDVYVEKGWRHIGNRANPKDFKIDGRNAKVEKLSNTEFHVDGIPWHEPERVEPGTFEELSEMAAEELEAEQNSELRSAKESIDNFQEREDSLTSLTEFSPVEDYTTRYQMRIDNAVTIDESGEWPVYSIPQIQYSDIDDIDSQEVHIRFPDGVVYEFPSEYSRPDSMPIGRVRDRDDAWSTPPSKNDFEVIPKFKHASNPIFGTLQSSASTRADMYQLVLDVVDDDPSAMEQGERLSDEAVGTLMVLVPGVGGFVLAVGTPFMIMGALVAGKITVATASALVIISDGLNAGLDIIQTIQQLERRFDRKSGNDTIGKPIAFHDNNDEKETVKKHAQRANYLSKCLIPGITSGSTHKLQSDLKELANLMDTSDLDGGVNNSGTHPSGKLTHDTLHEVVDPDSDPDSGSTISHLNSLISQTPEMFVSEHRMIDAVANPDKYTDSDEENVTHPESGEYSVAEFRGDMSNAGQKAEDGPTEISEMKWAIETPQGPSTPLVTDEYLVVLFSSGPTVQVLDRDDGNIVWERSFEDADRVGPAPAVADGRVVFALDGDVVSFDLHNGGETDSSGKIQPQWRSEIDELGRQRLNRTLTVSDGAIYLTGDESNLVAVTLDSGKRIWEASTGGGEMSVTSPAVDSNAVYAVLDGDLYAFDAIDGTERWSVSDYGLGGDAVVVVRDTVIALEKDESVITKDNVVVHGFSIDNGDHKWAIETDGDDAYAPVSYDGHLYLAGEDGFLGHDGALARLDPKSEEVHQIQDLPRGISGPPTIADGVAYLVERRTGVLHAVDLEVEEHLWRQRLDIESDSVAIEAGVLYCGTNSMPSEGSHWSLTNDHVVAFE